MLLELLTRLTTPEAMATIERVTLGVLGVLGVWLSQRNRKKLRRIISNQEHNGTASAVPKPPKPPRPPTINPFRR